MTVQIEGVVPKYVRPETKAGTYRFPYERQNDYVGIITFRPIRYFPPEVSSGAVKTLLTRSAGNGILSQLANGEQGIISSAIEGYKQAQTDPEFARDYYANTPNLKQDPATTEDPNGRASKNVVDRNRGVILYLPASLQFDDTISYSDIGLGTIAQLV